LTVAWTMKLSETKKYKDQYSIWWWYDNINIQSNLY